MRAKEKAIELVVKYQRDMFLIYKNAKQCALIEVYEIITKIYENSSLEKYHINNEEMNEFEALQYWKEVKQEIENL